MLNGDYLVYRYELEYLNEFSEPVIESYFDEDSFLRAVQLITEAKLEILRAQKIMNLESLWEG